MNEGLLRSDEGQELSVFQGNLQLLLAPLSSKDEGVSGVVRATASVVEQLTAVLKSSESAVIKRAKIAMVCDLLSREVSYLPLKEGVAKVVQFFNCFENISDSAHLLNSLSFSDFFDLKNPAIFIAFMMKDTKRTVFSNQSKISFYKSIFGEFEEGDLCVFTSESEFANFFESLDSETSGNLGKILAKDMLSFFISEVLELPDFDISEEELIRLKKTGSLHKYLMNQILESIREESELSNNFLLVIEGLYPKTYKEFKQVISNFIYDSLVQDSYNYQERIRLPRLSTSANELHEYLTTNFEKPSDLRNQVQSAFSQINLQQATLSARSAITADEIVDSVSSDEEDDGYNFDYDDEGGVTGL